MFADGTAAVGGGFASGFSGGRFGGRIFRGGLGGGFGAGSFFAGVEPPGLTTSEGAENGAEGEGETQEYNFEIIHKYILAQKTE